MLIDGRLVDAGGGKSVNDKIDSLSKAPSEYTWTATEGQLTYTLPSGQSYNPNSKWFEVSVGGASVQPDLIEKTSSTSFKLLVPATSINAGLKVVARWVEPFVPAASGHKSIHEVGGQDEIDLTKLKGYDVVDNEFLKVNKKFISVTDPPFNAVGDFDEVLGTGTDNRSAIQKCFDESPLYSNILIPEGVFKVSDYVSPREGQTITFLGKIALDDGGVVKNAVFRCSKPNITLKNPRIDGRWQHNTVDTVVGNQTVIDNYGTGTNLRIEGGIIEGGADNNFAGGRDNLTIRDTIFRNCGEHALYLNGILPNGGGYATGITLDNIKVEDIANIITSQEGHAIQIRNCKDVKVIGGSYDCGNPELPTFIFNTTNVDGLQIIGGTGKNLTHIGFSFDVDTKNVIVKDFLLDRRNTTSRGSTSFCRASGTNIVFENCTFYGFTSNSSQPDKVLNCNFYEIPSQLNIIKKTKFINCNFHYMNSQRFLAIEGALPELISCDFYGVPTGSVGIWYASGKTTNPERFIIRDCKFKDYSGANIILFEYGKDHQIVGNEMALTTSANAIKLSSGVTGKTLLADNYLPNGKIYVVSDTTATIQRDNITAI